MAVVIPTVLRPSLLRAVRSVYGQDLKQRIQLLIGIDQRVSAEECLDTILRECPDHVALTILDLGHSTSVRHGGIYPNRYGGAIRTILSYAANSAYVAYLDDDDWWGHQHLSALLAAVVGKDWAFSHRWLVDPETGWPICRDEWDSLGPGRGIARERFGGFVSTSNLLLKKDACHFIFPAWSLSPFTDGSGEDILVFQKLMQQQHSWAASAEHSCFYELRREVQADAHHAREFAARGIRWIDQREQIGVIENLSAEALRLYHDGALDAAPQKCTSALSLHAHQAPSRGLQALVHWQSGDRAAALTSIAHAMAVDDRDPQIVETWRKLRAGPA